MSMILSGGTRFGWGVGALSAVTGATIGTPRIFAIAQNVPLGRADDVNRRAFNSGILGTLIFYHTMSARSRTIF